MPNIALAKTDRYICPSSASGTQSVTKGSEVGLVVVVLVENSDRQNTAPLSRKVTQLLRVFYKEASLGDKGINLKQLPCKIFLQV